MFSVPFLGVQTTRCRRTEFRVPRDLSSPSSTTLNGYVFRNSPSHPLCSTRLSNKKGTARALPSCPVIFVFQKRSITPFFFSRNTTAHRYIYSPLQCSRRKRLVPFVQNQRSNQTTAPANGIRDAFNLVGEKKPLRPFPKLPPGPLLMSRMSRLALDHLLIAAADAPKVHWHAGDNEQHDGDGL